PFHLWMSQSISGVLLGLLLFCPKVWAADVQVLATVDRNEVGVGDSFTYKITVTSDSSVEITPPRLGNLQNLELINTWPRSAVQSIMAGGNFQVVHTKEFNYMLAAKAKGQAVLPAANVIVDGQSYNTDPITIEVSDDPSSQQNPKAQNNQNDPFSQMEELEQQMFNQLLQRRFGGAPGNPAPQMAPINPKEAFFLRAETDRTEAYVGEQVTANWYLYTRGTITDIDTLKYPTLKGFWKEEIEMATRLNFEQVVINGIPYQRALLVSYALFPIKSGEAKIDTYKARCTVITPGNMGFGRPYQFTKASPPIALKVIDVPKENRPADFTGAVGSFKVSASLDRDEVPAHQPITWKIRIAGRGNAKLIDLPAFDLPPGLELYDQKSDSKFSKNGTSYKDFEILLIPREEGEVIIPSLKLSVFNPDKKAFERVESSPLTLKVGPGKRTDQPLAQNSGVNSAQPPQKEKAQWPFFQNPTPSEASQSILSAPMWWSLFSLSFLSVVAHGVLALGRTRRKETLRQILTFRKKKLKKLMAEKKYRDFGVEMSNSIYKILGLVVGSGGGSVELNSLLKIGPASLRREHGEALRALIAEVESVAFAPEEIAKTKFTSENLSKLLESFDSLMVSAIQKVEEDE
ncbi:MAG: protein BatD, partial [Bdellovibrionales bacterium]|nr:protein BatD [Bdellovibrionales bacterium]